MKSSRLAVVARAVAVAVLVAAQALEAEKAEAALEVMISEFVQCQARVFAAVLLPPA